MPTSSSATSGAWHGMHVVKASTSRRSARLLRGKSAAAAPLAGNGATTVVTAAGPPATEPWERAGSAPALSSEPSAPAAAAPADGTASATRSRRRAAGEVAPKKRARTAPPPPAELPPLQSDAEIQLCTTLEQPTLSFSLEDAKAHLCRVDPRFVPLFAQMELRLYEELRDGTVKQLNLFRVLTTSILGQQISWRAARSILYKFCRLFDPSMPPATDVDLDACDKESWRFPSPREVVDATDDLLRSAGLSGAKVAYVRDVARRFADGRLDVRRIVRMDPASCIEELVQVKGVGRWTAEMLLMFAMRSPDILPVGDLGVQRGMVHFYLADHHGPTVSELKRRALWNKADHSAAVLQQPLPLPALSSSVLQARLNGNKTSKKMYLDPDEMTALADLWAPYRSVACMFMWHLERAAS